MKTYGDTYAHLRWDQVTKGLFPRLWAAKSHRLLSQGAAWLRGLIRGPCLWEINRILPWRTPPPLVRTKFAFSWSWSVDDTQMHTEYSASDLLSSRIGEETIKCPLWAGARKEEISDSGVHRLLRHHPEFSILPLRSMITSKSIEKFLGPRNGILRTSLSTYYKQIGQTCQVKGKSHRFGQAGKLRYP